MDDPQGSPYTPNGNARLLLLYYMIALTIPFIKCDVPEIAEFAALGA